MNDLGLVEYRPPHDQEDASRAQIPVPADFPFLAKADGVYRREDNDDGVEWRRVCSPLEVIAKTRDECGENWGRLLAITDQDGNRHEWAMPMEMLAGGGDEYRRVLLSLGLVIEPGPWAKRTLHEYIATAPVDGRARCVNRIGWHDAAAGAVFVLPDHCFGDTPDERVLLQTSGTPDYRFANSGDLAAWQNGVAGNCAGNSRLVMALSTAFAAPLLHLTGDESGGIHFVGQSRSGKTTALRCAGSVWGGGDVNGFLRTWRTTSNGLEAIAAAHCDCLLALDEMGQVDAREAGEIAYMLANGSGKGRARRDGLARASQQWRLLFLSTGELALGDKMSEIGKRPRAGQEVRLVDVPADAGAGFGLFENLHGFTGAHAFADHLRDAASRLYGTAGPAFLEKLVATDRETLRQDIGAAIQTFRKENVPPDASGQVLSVANRFALIGAAGTLATFLGILPWTPEEASNAAAICFRAWLERRGDVGAAEVGHGLAQIRAYLEAHGDSRFQDINDPDARPVNNRVGFRKRRDDGRFDYLVLPEAWRNELCAGHDARQLTRELQQRDLLHSDSEGKPQTPHRVPGMGTKRFYHLSSDLLGSADITDNG